MKPVTLLSYIAAVMQNWQEGKMDEFHAVGQIKKIMKKYDGELEEVIEDLISGTLEMP